MPATVHLLRGLDAKLLTDQCRTRYLAERGIATVLWIAPTERVRDEVLTALARTEGVVLAGNIVTFPELARALAEPLPAGRILPESHQRLLLDGLLLELRDRKVLKLYREMVGRPGFGEAVFSLLSELQGLGITPALFETAVRSLSEDGDKLRPKDNELAVIYARYVLLLSQNQFLDRAALYTRAWERLAQGLPLRFANLQIVYVDGFSDFTPPQLALLQGLAGHVVQMVITLPADAIDGDERNDLFLVAEQTATELRNRLGAIDQEFVASSVERPAGLAHVRQNLFRPDAERSADAAGLALIEAPGQVGEVRLVARAVKELLLAGTLPETVLVSARHLSGYADLVRSTFGEFGLPVDLEATEPLGSQPAVATLLAAAGLADADFPFDETTALLRSTWLAPEWPEFVADPEIAIDCELLLRLLEEPRGKMHFLAAARRHAEKVYEGLEDEEAAGSARRRLHELAKRCEPFLIRFLAAWDTAPKRATLADHADWLQRFAIELGITGQAPVLDRLWHELDRWAERERQLKRAVPEYDRAEFLQLAGSLAASAGLPRIESGPGRVRVVPAELAVALTCDHLFLLGLGERGFPAPPGADPLYDEAERQALHATNAGLALAAEHLPSEMLLFFRLIAGAQKSATLAFAAVDAKGQELLPGAFLRAVRGLFAADSIPLVRREMSVEGLDADRPLSVAEYRVRYVVAGGDATPLGSDLTRHLHAARVMYHHRHDEPEFGPFDGMLSDPGARAELARRFGPNPSFSATALDQYIDCPFKFFASNVLKLDPLVEPAEDVEAHHRGSAYHRALARIHRAGTDQDAANERLADALDAAVAEQAEQSSSATTKMLWQLEGQRLRRSARRYAGQWAKFRDPWIEADVILEPRAFEDAFELSLDGFRLHGRIDRIDVGEMADGTIGFWVIDYKTGRSNFTATSVQNLLRVQLPIYAIGAEEKLGGRPLGMTYWLVASDGAKHIMPGRRPTAWLDAADAWQKYRGRLIAWLKTLVGRIQAAQFPLAPRTDDSCNHCPYQQSCRIGGDRNKDKVWDLVPPGREPGNADE